MRKLVFAIAATLLLGAFAVPSHAEAGWRGHGVRGPAAIGHRTFAHRPLVHRPFVHRPFVGPRVAVYRPFYRPIYRPVRYAVVAPAAYYYGVGAHCVVRKEVRWNRWGERVKVVRRICY